MLHKIIVASDCIQSLEKVHSSVERALNNRHGFTFHRVVLDGDVDPWNSGEVCGVVLDGPVAIRGSSKPFLLWCLDQVAKRDDFRLWLTPWRDSPADGLKWTKAEQDLLERLEDTVQCPFGIEVEEICVQIAVYADLFEVIVKQSAWRKIQLRASALLGRTALVLQTVCWVSGTALALWLPIWDPHATLGRFRGWEGEVAVLSGVGGVPLLALLIYAYTRYGPLLGNMSQAPRGVFYAGVASLVGPAILMIPFRLHAPGVWIVTGVLMGAMLDSIRRMSHRRYRASLTVDPDSVTPLHCRVPPELRVEGTEWPNPWRIPLLPLKEPRIFVSYSRSSVWGNSVAHSLLKPLHSVGADCFFDNLIAPGENWRRALNRHLSEATVVVAVLDESTMGRKWPASEIEAALRGRQLTGAPEIIIIGSMSQGTATKEAWRWLPIFRELLKPGSNGQPIFPVVSHDATTAQALAFRLHGRAYASPSLLPPAVGRIAEGLWVRLTAFLSIWAAACGVAGHMAFLVAGAAVFGLDLGQWLAERKLCGVASVGATAWAFAALRHSLGARFAFFDIRAPGAFGAHRDAVIGLMILLLVWGKHLTALDGLWMVLAAYASYVAVDDFWSEKDRQRRLQSPRARQCGSVADTSVPTLPPPVG